MDCGVWFVPRKVVAIDFASEVHESVWLYADPLAAELDVQVVLLPEHPLVSLCVERSDRGVVADLLRYQAVAGLLVHQLISLPQERVERLAVPALTHTHTQ